ncbi:SAG-related sequence SRS22E [Toxoplasma gondii TgCatPRC2]|uniref:SAG-related sequence SRS22E n=2 Tax=Toxoplasma gondii TaxID=5811 RepID=A0A151H032_TOXGO|nr:SAG-related sequence SRS22E [Toxoplasma gondii ARI]KYK62728.1 SAG-related sequence SRS22E [Toxoplasma gondii TgCatPRC2]
MKFSLLTLGALALAAQQTSAVAADNTLESTQQDKDTTCSKNKSLSFNITQAGEFILFTCGEDVPTLDPAFNASTPEMFEGDDRVKIRDFLPGATLENVTTADAATATLVARATAAKYNFTVPALPSDDHSLHVYCRKDASKTRGEEKDECKVTFHIASSAIRPVMAASAIAGVVASLLHFA